VGLVPAAGWLEVQRLYNIEEFESARDGEVPGFLNLGGSMRSLLAALVIVLVANAACGYVTEVSISEVAVISNEEKEFRILFKIGELDIPDSCRIDFATIVLPKVVDSPEVAFEVCAVTEPWSAATVSWTGSWTNEGGDFAEACLASWVIHAGVDGPGHFIDITEFVRAVHKGAADYGLIIKPVVGDQEGFNEDLQTLFTGLGQLKVRVLYRGRDSHRGLEKR
jgi:hypothetical protein